MIYTHGLTSNTTHILVYDNTTPICVIKLSIIDQEKQWVEYVQSLLNKLGERRGLDVKMMNARPFEYLNDMEIMNE